MTRPYKTRERGPVITCCEVEIYDDRTGRYWHNKSTLHRNYRRISRYLEKDCMTFSEIGLRLGVSREMVRWIANRLGANKGMDRQRVCTLTRGDQKWRQLLLSNRLGRFINEVEAHGLAWERVPAKHGASWFVDRVLVENRLVRVLASWKNNGYVVIRKCAMEADVVVYELPDSEGWLLAPYARRVVASSTLFALYPNLDGLGRTRDRRHDYHTMVNDWDVFKQSKSTSQAA